MEASPTHPCVFCSQLLSYQNILKIDNLVGFDKLVKLQLDNNIIEKIENLSHLTSLEVRLRAQNAGTSDAAAWGVGGFWDDSGRLSGRQQQQQPQPATAEAPAQLIETSTFPP